VAVARLGAVVIAMGLAALFVAYAGFGWPVLVVGVPALLATGLVVLTAGAAEELRRRRQQQRPARWEDAAELPGGLMSGFFEVPAQARPSDLETRARATSR
jgi:hypothetical protein